MGLRNALMERIGAEREMDRWHYPTFTKGCWGSHNHRLCWLCKARYPIALIRVLVRTARK